MSLNLALRRFLSVAPKVMAAAALGAGLVQPAVAQESPAATTSVPATTDAQLYRINAGDILEVFVWGEERLQRQVRVLPDGTFVFPLAGTLVAEGRTPADIADEIRFRIQNQFREVVPEVTVSVSETAGLRIYVVGKVGAPGSFSVGRYVNPLQALALAGGPAEFADVDNALLLRESPSGQIAHRVRLNDVLKGARRVNEGEQLPELAPMKSGDVLVIP